MGFVTDILFNFMLFAEVITVQNTVFRGSEKKDMSPDIQSNKNSIRQPRGPTIACFLYLFLSLVPSQLSFWYRTETQSSTQATAKNTVSLRNQKKHGSMEYSRDFFQFYFFNYLLPTLL